MTIPKIIFYAFFPSGGIGKYAHELLQVMHAHHRAAVEIELVCTRDFAWLGEARYATWPRLFSIKHPAPPVRKARFLLAQLLNPWRLAERARKTKAQWIHFCNINPLTYPLWRHRVKQTGARMAATVHDVRRSKGILHLGWELRQLARFYRDCDALFVHSRQQAEDLLAFAGVQADRIHVVPHGPFAFKEDEALAGLDKAALRRRYGLPDDKRVALFYGFIRDEKQLDTLLEALASGADNWRMLVAGSGGAKGHKPVSHYASRIASLGLQDRVRLDTRFIPDGETPALFRMADCLVLPYSTRFSSQSGVLNIAASYDTPVMATPCPSFTEILGACPIGYVCAGDDAVSIRSGLEALGQQLDQKTTFDFSTYRETYGWKENAQETVNVYLREATGRCASPS